MSEKRALPVSTVCFVCGVDNPAGLRLKFYMENGKAHARFTPSQHQAGFRDVVHGGVVTALLDETMGWAAANELKRMCMTGELTVRFVAPAPVGMALDVSACSTRSSRHLCYVAGEVRGSDGTLYARATGKFVPLSKEQTDYIDARLIYSEGETSIFAEDG